MKKNVKENLLYYLTFIRQRHADKDLSLGDLDRFKEAIEKVPCDEDDYEKIIDDNFKRFLKHVQDAHKPAQDQRSGCEPCGDTSQYEFAYTVYCNDGAVYNIDGNGSMCRDGRFLIFFDAARVRTKAFFENVKAYTIEKIEEEEDDE